MSPEWGEGVVEVTRLVLLQLVKYCENKCSKREKNQVKNFQIKYWTRVTINFKNFKNVLSLNVLEVAYMPEFTKK